MDEVKRETVGASARRLMLKDDVPVNVIDQMRENLTDYDKNIELCIKNAKKDFDGDFYVVVITKKERLMKNVLRGYFTARLSCPTPDYDQSVYKFIRKDEHLEFLWTIPSADAVNYLRNNAAFVPPEQYDLLKYVLMFSSGSLLMLAKELNGESSDSILLK